MRNTILFFLIAFTFLTSCSTDESVVGTWKLTTWSVQIPMDLNDDATSSVNLLDEAICNNNEMLKFEANGSVSTNMTYNPKVTVSISDETKSVYTVSVECDKEGSIGAAGDFTQNKNLVSLFDQTALIDDDQLTIVYKDAIDVHNEDLTVVVAKKDLTLIYTRNN
ncbi:MAG: hypothetical protein ACSHXF_12975 [Aquaticitalea sp.]